MTRLQAVSHICALKGGSQARMLQTTDGRFWAVRARNNSQHRRILVNDWIACSLMRRIGLPAAEPAIIDVPADLIAREHIAILRGSQRKPWTAGPCFGSLMAAGPDRAVYDYLPDRILRQTDLAPLIGATAADRWMANADGSQAVWWRGAGGEWSCNLIDRGFCFHAHCWNFESHTGVGIYPRTWIYERVTGPDSFEPWLSAIQALRWPDLQRIADQMPDEWLMPEKWTGASEPHTCADEYWRLLQVLVQLIERAKRLPELLASARTNYRNPFPNWVNVSSRHPLFGTIDHIIPKSAGGTDALANRAPVHRCCNGIKASQEITPALRYECFHVAMAAFSKLDRCPNVSHFNRARKKLASYATSA